MNIIGIDPGFANIGWSAIQLYGDGSVSLSEVGLIKTSKSDKKKKVLAANDNYRRAREIALGIKGLITKFDPTAICSEAMSFPRNASAAAKVAMTWGVIAAIAEELGVPVLMASPKEVKLAVGAQDSSKEAVQNALRAKTPNLDKLLQEAGVPPSLHEHPCDSLASIYACLRSEEIRLLMMAFKHKNQ